MTPRKNAIEDAQDHKANDIFFINDEEKDSENKASDPKTVSINDYEILEKIGKGTFGEVYKAVLKSQKENF